MTTAGSGVESLPAEVRPYLTELIRRTRIVYDAHLIGVLAVGSLALADYRHGRSDIDVMVVVDPAAPARTHRELAAALAHNELPCPAAGLELVVYDADFAASGSSGAGYLLNMNTGPLLPAVADFEPKDSPGFWYVIDRAIAHQCGVSLAGRPVRAVLAPPSRNAIRAAVSASVREHATGVGHLPDNRVLNGCRAVLFGRTGRWMPKREAGRVVAESAPEFAVLIEQAIRSFAGPRSAALPLPADDIATFSDWVCRSVTEAASTNGE